MKALKIAIQKSGKLSDTSLKLISEAGIQITNDSRNLFSQSGNFPLQTLYLRDDDIPKYVEDGVADAGIVGEDMLIEKGFNLRVMEKLGFARCRLSLAIPRSVEYEGLSFFEGKKIATSYPSVLKSFLRKKQIRAEVHEISGSVEIAPCIGLADAIFDVVSSGSTLTSNGLREVETVMYSEAVLVAGRNLEKEVAAVLEKFLFRLRAVMRADNNKYILLNAPNDKLEQIISILPGIKSPTVMPLALEGWSSLHSVLSENEFWEVIDKLKENGAQGILVIPIEKMII